MGTHTTASTLPGALTPICNSCGVSLCWDISDEDYAEDKGFWDEWCCRDCNPHYEGALKRYREAKQSKPSLIYAGIGSRETPAHIIRVMRKVASLLASKGWLLRSGGAEGADTAFEEGCLLVEGKNEIFLPWKGFNKNPSQLFFLSKESMAMAEKYHPSWTRLSEAAKKMMARNCYQVLGAKLQSPAQIVLCWTKDGQASGGTGQAIRIAEDLHIPVMNLFGCIETETIAEDIVADIEKILLTVNAFKESPKASEQEKLEAIESFQGPYRWLSNFVPAKVVLDGVTYPSVENAYQAAKTKDLLRRKIFETCTSSEAKKAGRLLEIRSNWADIKLAVMADLIGQKFAFGTVFASQLLATGDKNIVEGNTWGDTYWGVCNGKGQNHLGQLIMAQRLKLLSQNNFQKPDSEPVDLPVQDDGMSSSSNAVGKAVEESPSHLKEVKGNIWDHHFNGAWVCVTTNGICKKNGDAVMGAGIAKDAAERFPDLPAKLGKYLKQYGNRLFVFKEYRIITFPTKHNWKDQSDIALIEKSCRELMAVADKFGMIDISMPRPGCSNGGLKWSDVKAVITPLLDQRITVCDIAD